ncbi:MAG TPA: hypothetical protein VLD37_05270 [Candidatus Bilamarchaeum sp.]|nr:hypothetical protein [Candidatus Bilamarchaeum sp.]
MAEPIPRQLDSERINQLNQLAEQAFEAFRSYVISGSQSSKDKFLRIWNANKDDDAFFNRFQAGITGSPEVFRTLLNAYKAQKGGYPSPEEFIAAIQACYAELLRPRSERNVSQITQDYGPAFVAELDRMVTARSVPVRVPTQVDDSTINAFLNMLQVSGTRPNAPAQERLQFIIDAIDQQFALHSRENASGIAQALLYAYTLMNAEDRSRFSTWLRTMKSADRTALANQIVTSVASRQIRLPYELVRTSFEAWKQNTERQRAEVARLEAELRLYPPHIREGTLISLSHSFAQAPTDYALENIGRRVEYVRKRIDMLTMMATPQSRQQAEQLREELGLLTTWLGGLGITATRPEDGLSRLAAGINALQNFYYAMNPERPELADYLSAVQSNGTLSAIYRRFILAVDARTSRIFSGLNADSPTFVVQMQERISSRVSAARVRRGQAQWNSDYYPLLSPLFAPPPTTSGAVPSSTSFDAQMYNRTSTLEPLLAVAFLDYLEVAARNGLTGAQEHRIVAATVSRLYAVNPLLVVKYFAAAKNLATICEDNSEAFLRALTDIAARISVEAAPVISGVSPTQILPLNVRRIITRLASSMEAIAQIPRSSVAQYDRLNLLDERLQIQPYAPHSIEQRPSGYMPNLLVNPNQPATLLPPYPFPQYLVTPTPTSPFTAGGLFTSPPTYSGNITLPTFSPIEVFTGAASVGTSMRYYLNPEHPVVSISQYLPGVNINGLSMTRLLNEIQRAFIPTDRPDYSRQIISGGGAGGVMGTKPSETDPWNVGGAGMGTLITPTGGASLGGGRQDTTTFGGLSAVAVPVGIPVLGGPSAGRKVTGIDSAVAGVQRLDDGTQQVLLSAVQTMWDPNNPSQMLLSLNQQQDALGTKYMTARYFFIDKQGTIFELKGGQNDLVDVLNFAAGYADNLFMTPTTSAWNYEPTIQRGGGVLAVDIGKSPFLVHAQAVPFFLPEGTPQPFLLEWTGAGATTVENASPRRTTIFEVGLPGKIMRFQNPIDPTRTDNFTMQEVDFMLRRVQRPDAWELRVGGGGAQTPVGPAAKGGIFIRTQRLEPPKSWFGGGAFYEGGATNMQAIALLSQSADAAAYIESLHRIGATLYGSRENSDRLLVGALAHVVAQLRQDATTDPATGQVTLGKLRYDQTFYRFVGLLIGLRNAARLDVGRYSGLDQMINDYQAMASQVANDPSQAAALTQQFQATYASLLQQVFDNYQLGIQINRDFSLEATLLMREQANKWTDQVPDTISGRVLFTWSTGFWRAFASVPLLGGSTFGSAGAQSPLGYVPPVQTSTTTTGTTGTVAPVTTAPPTSAGIIGTGLGVDLVNDVFMQRAAADVGLLVARYEVAQAATTTTTGAPPTTGVTSPTAPTVTNALTPVQPWFKAGWFVQGAVRIFSNVMEDSNQYRRLVTDYEGYLERIRDGRTDDITEAVRSKMCDAIDTSAFPPELVRRIRSGARVTLTADQTRQLERALWNGWFYDRKFEVQRKFNGHLRAFLAASGYVYNDRTYWDIGTFIESVDRFKAYLITAQREELGVFAGAEVTSGRVRVAAMGGGTKSGFGAAASIGYKIGTHTVPVEIGLSGYGRSAVIPDYSAPFFIPPQRTGTPEFGSLFFYTIGSTRGVSGLAPPNPNIAPPMRYNY